MHESHFKIGSVLNIIPETSKENKEKNLCVYIFRKKTFLFRLPGIDLALC